MGERETEEEVQEEEKKNKERKNKLKEFRNTRTRGEKKGENQSEAQRLDERKVRKKDEDTKKDGT